MHIFAYCIVLIVIITWMWFRGKSNDATEPAKNNDVGNVRKIKFVLHHGPYILDKVIAAPTSLYLYENNLAQPVNNSRAHIGTEKNSIAMITRPDRDKWFRDDDTLAIDCLDNSFAELAALVPNYKTIVIPEDLFRLFKNGRSRAPKLHLYALGLLYELIEHYDPIALTGDIGDWMRSTTDYC
jgi:hypothetical protein